ncbi:MAG: type II toxin-antitoxin system RelE/ParE family toxin [Candidatus Omnitrophica bacterium]|nr:type II toxin-antitoxin system RelE/ParE family toxin [Candidatus Omnitrophota bacterium]
MTIQPRYEALFYMKAGGECPMDGFLDALPVKVRAKIAKWIELLEEQGPDLPRPYADALRDKIRELRVKFGSVQYRLLYFFMEKKVILTHGFVKRTDQVPKAEIEKALSAMEDFGRRMEKGDISI